MTYVKTYLTTLKTHVANLKRDAKDLSRDLQRLEVRGKLGSKTLYSLYLESRFTYTANVRFKFRTSQNIKCADKNNSKQFLWIKNGMKLLILV